MVRINVSHLTRLSAEDRAAYLIAHYRTTLASTGTATFRPHLAQFLAHLAGVQGSAEASCYVGGHTFYATRNGGYQHVALYEGRRSLPICRKLALVGDRGVLDQRRGEFRTEKRLLLTLADPDSLDTVWTAVPSEAAQLARACLQNPLATDPISEKAALLDLPEPVTEIPLHLLRDRGDFSLGETIAQYLVLEKKLSQTEAAEALGMGDAAEIRVLLKRARLKAQTTPAPSGPQFQAATEGRIPESENVSQFGDLG